MTQELIDKFISSARKTFLEEDRNSNFPNENTLVMTDKTAWEEYCEASLDLSDQDDLGEAGAIAALNPIN